MTLPIENITNLNITDIGGLLQATNTYSESLYGIGVFFIIYVSAFLVVHKFTKMDTRESLIAASFTALLSNYFLYQMGILSLWWGILPGILLAVSLFLGD